MRTATCHLKGPPSGKAQHAFLASQAHSYGADALSKDHSLIAADQARCPACGHWLIPQIGAQGPYFACLCTKAKKEKTIHEQTRPRCPHAA